MDVINIGVEYAKYRRSLSRLDRCQSRIRERRLNLLPHAYVSAMRMLEREKAMVHDTWDETWEYAEGHGRIA